MMIKAISVYLYLQLFIGAVCIAQPKAVYNMFLQTPVPANGTAVVFNAPILRWPYQKGKQVKYDVQLSPDADFKSTGTISEMNLQGAIFNPHQKLATGKWYWHYRVAGKQWSESQSFTVTAAALPMVSPVAAEFLSKIPQQHPRILLNDAAENTRELAERPAAKVIIEGAEKALSKKILTEADAKVEDAGGAAKQDKKINQDATVALGNNVNQMVVFLCEAYLLTGKDAYRAKAIAVGLEVANWNPEGISGASDFMDGISMYSMALVFDTFYEQLNPDQRAALQKAIRERAAKFYKSWVNNIESKVLSGHVWQLILNEFFKTSLALYKHEPEAKQWLSYAYELFLARSPVLGGLDGGWVEGGYYFQMNMEMLIEIPDKIKAYTGFDFIKAHPWYQQQADWLIYNVSPGSSADGYGDNTEELFKPPASYAAFADVMARLTQNTRYSWYLNKMRQYDPVVLADEPRLRWYRLLYTDKLQLPSFKASLQLPMARIFTESGIAALHTNPQEAKKDIMVAMRSSPFGAYGHILSDQNTFNILCGGKRLFFRTGYKVAMDDPHRLGWSKHTKSMNGVLIDGAGQPYSAEAYGHFTRFLQGNQIAYIKGDASNAYQSVETKEDYGMKKFYRHILLLKPGIIIIYDELESQKDAEWSWLIHSLKNMQLDQHTNQFTSTIEHAKGVGKLWSSQPFTWAITNKFEIPAVGFRRRDDLLNIKYEDNQWHLKAINNTKTSKIRFLSVIQVTADGKTLPFIETGKKEGITKLHLGDWEIEASLSCDLPPQLLVRSLSGNTAFAAYGSDINFHGKIYKSTMNDGSKLLEWADGKATFTETGDQPLPAIR